MQRAEFNRFRDGLQCRKFLVVSQAEINRFKQGPLILCTSRLDGVVSAECHCGAAQRKKNNNKK